MENKKDKKSDKDEDSAIFDDDDDIRAIDIKDAYSWDVYGVFREDSTDRDLAKRFLDIDF